MKQIGKVAAKLVARMKAAREIKARGFTPLTDDQLREIYPSKNKEEVSES